MSGTNIGEAKVQQRALPSAIDDLERAMSGLESTLYSLQSQLYPLLDSVQEVGDDGAQTKGTIAPYHHSQQIIDVVYRVRALNSLGADLLSRLHV